MSGANLINLLLAHHLPITESIPQELDFIISILTEQRPLYNLELELGLGNTVIKRWTSRLTALIKPTSTPQIRSAGFKLLHITYTHSVDVLLATAKETLSFALNILESPKNDTELFVNALEVVRLVLGTSSWYLDWARENIGAAVVQRTVKALIKAANGTVEEIKLPALYAIVSIIPLFPTPLRPIYASLHDLSLAFLCSPAIATEKIEAGASLLVSLYMIAKNGKDGLREAWRLTLEGLAGSIDNLVGAVTSNIFAEDPLMNHTLSPFKLPPLHANTSIAALERIESLTIALSLALRTPTSEKTGPVEVPVGALSELGVRLVGLNLDTPIKERIDPTLLTLSLSLLPRLQFCGAQLLAQLGLCVGARLVANASEILGTISRTLITYPLRSPMRPVLSTSYSIILQSMGAAVDPEEGKKSLARVWRTILEDIGSIAVDPIAAGVIEEGKKSGGNGKGKNKRARTFDVTESLELAGRKVRIDEIDLRIAERALATLERLLASPHSHFLPPKLILSTSRLLLSITLSPSFFTSQPSVHPSTPSQPFSSNPTYFPKTNAGRGIEIALQSSEFRRGTLRCLAEVLRGEGGSLGLVDRAVEVWRVAAGDRDLEIKSIAFAALTQFSAQIHPTLPPLQTNTTFARQKALRVGGEIGDEEDLIEGSDEFAPKLVVSREAGDEEEEEMVVDEEEEVVEVKKTQGFPSSRGFGPTSGFPLPVPTAITVSMEPPTNEEEDDDDVFIPTPVAASSFIVAPIRPTPTVAPPKAVVKKAVVEEEEEEDSDDDMPEIDMASDDE